MRYLLVDRIVEWKERESIKGIKNVALSEDFLEFHFPKKPVMSGVLLLEALVQLAGWLEAASSDFQRWFLLSQVHRATFYGFALPGDSVQLEVRRRSEEPSQPNSFSGLCTVGGKRKVVAEFEGEVVPLAELENIDDQRRLFQFLTRSESFG
jgi:3-hydroxyacyl-[acyl-carrier-protein] dehydratase